jgi:pimeloyl-ACP methyl ester carboxylesterase
MMSKRMNVELCAVDGHIVRGTHRAVTNPRATILLVHGITADRREGGYYDRLADRLAGSGVASLAIDYRGHGESDMPIERLTLSGVLLDIDIAWKYMEERYPGGSLRRIISGNSFGAGVSFLYGMKRKQVDDIFLTMPVLSYVDDVSRVNSHWREEAKERYIKYSSIHLSPLLASEFYFFDYLIERCESAKNYTILHGEADTDVPFSASKVFSQDHARGRVFGLAGMDHCWAAPGDPQRETSESEKNQIVAVERSVELLEEVLSR